MLEFIILIIGIVLYELYQMYKIKNYDNLFLFMVFVSITVITLYIYESKIFGESISEILLKLINSDYFSGE